MSKKTIHKKKPSIDSKVVKTPATEDIVKILKKMVPEQKKADIEVLNSSAEIVPKIQEKKSSKPKKQPIQKEKLVKDKLKKKVVDLPPEHEKYFVYLRNPLEYRRHLLESSKKILYCLKNYQKILLIRQKKLEEMQKLKASLKELIYLNKKFNERLPKYNVTFLEDLPNSGKKSVSTPTPIPEPKLKKEPVQEMPRERTEVDKLEDSLAKIEAKLRSLK
jgi:hypothetical protein